MSLVCILILSIEHVLVQVFARKFPAYLVTSLLLIDNVIGDAGAEHASRMLHENSTLIHLDLSSTSSLDKFSIREF